MARHANANETDDGAGTSGGGTEPGASGASGVSGAGGVSGAVAAASRPLPRRRRAADEDLPEGADAGRVLLEELLARAAAHRPRPSGGEGEAVAETDAEAGVATDVAAETDADVAAAPAEPVYVEPAEPVEPADAAARAEPVEPVEWIDVVTGADTDSDTGGNDEAVAGTDARPRASGTGADLRLLRTNRRLLVSCLLAVVIPFAIFTAVLLGIGRADVYLIWVWIPTVTAGVLVGMLLDRAHAGRPTG